MKRMMGIILAVGIVISSPGFSAAASLSLPQTGQTICYDGYDGAAHWGAPIPCTGTAQDGEIQAGVPWPIPRFTDHGNGTMTDNLTGLMWAKDGNLPGGHRNWQGALDYIAGMNSGGGLGGHTDWHLPNLNEIQSLLHAGHADSIPWLASEGFTNVAPSYWTSTTQMYPNGQDTAWLVEIYDGTTFSQQKTYSDLPVWPVRVALSDTPAPVWRTGQNKCYDSIGAEIGCAGTGQDGDILAGVPWPSPRFSDNGDGTVTDNLTGLIWLQDMNCLGTNYPTEVSGNRAKWSDALIFVAGINDGTYALCGAGHTDWRLPNRKELQSLLDYSRYTPALPEGHPFTNLISTYPFSYWTATSSGYVGDDPNFYYAWYASLHDGMIDNSRKNWNPQIWPVRGPAQSVPPSMLWLLLLGD
jgi:hypothetical protein